MWSSVFCPPCQTISDPYHRLLKGRLVFPRWNMKSATSCFYIDLHCNDTLCGERSFVVEYTQLLLYNPADVYCKGVKVYSLKTSSSYIIIVLCTQRFSSNSCVYAMRIQIIYIMLILNCSFLVHMWCAINTLSRSLIIYFMSCEVTASLLPYLIHQISKINKIKNGGSH